MSEKKHGDATLHMRAQELAQKIVAKQNPRMAAMPVKRFAAKVWSVLLGGGIAGVGVTSHAWGWPWWASAATVAVGANVASKELVGAAIKSVLGYAGDVLKLLKPGNGTGTP